MISRMCSLALLGAIGSTCKPEPSSKPDDPLADYEPPPLPPGFVECPAHPGSPPPAIATPAFPLASTQYVYIDHADHTAGTCLFGPCVEGPILHPPPDDPAPLDAGVLLVLHEAHTTSGAAGSGGGGLAFPVRELPYTRESVTIHAVAADGTTTLSFRGLVLELGPGKRWDCQSSTVQRGQDQGKDYAIELVSTVFFENRGILDKPGQEPIGSP